MEYTATLGNLETFFVCSENNGMWETIQYTQRVGFLSLFEFPLSSHARGRDFFWICSISPSHRLCFGCLKKAASHYSLIRAFFHACPLVCAFASSSTLTAIPLQNVVSRTLVRNSKKKPKVGEFLVVLSNELLVWGSYNGHKSCVYTFDKKWTFFLLPGTFHHSSINIWDMKTVVYPDFSVLCRWLFVSHPFFVPSLSCVPR